MSNREFELVKISNAAQDKITYFLMAAAASGIGFAISQTKTEALVLHHLIWLFAVLVWSVSFWAGIRLTMNGNSVKFKNVGYVRSLNELENFEETEAKELESLTHTKFNESFEMHQTRMGFWGTLQMYTLLLGALVYISWHLVRMCLQTST